MSRDIYELIEKIIDKKVKGADTYINNGNRWLIFTDAKKWIFELTKEGTLWYNFYFFQRIFKLISLDVVENQHHITKWVQNFIQNGVKSTQAGNGFIDFEVEDTIQSGVKHTDWCQIGISNSVVDTIKNGVKNTHLTKIIASTKVEDTIKNGIKETKHNTFEDGLAMEEAIQNGVKRTELGGKDRKIDEIKDIVENGIKETTPGGYLGSVEMKGKPVHQFEHSKQGNDVENVIENGIKETKYCELHSLMRADHIIRDGVKETNWRKVDNFPEFEERVIENGIKETWGYEKQSQMIVNEVINKGKKTIWDNETNKL